LNTHNDSPEANRLVQVKGHVIYWQVTARGQERLFQEASFVLVTFLEWKSGGAGILAPPSMLNAPLV
jgi:hypothetical protein